MLLSKASHPKHGTTGPDTDPTTIGPEILSFITGEGSVAGRSESYANTLGSVLLPDVLVVQTDKNPDTAGWLSWLPLAPFSSGWGGRKLSDDVTDLALLALFGDPFGADPAGADGKEALTTDHVAFDSPLLATFPVRRKSQLTLACRPAARIGAAGRNGGEMSPIHRTVGGLLARPRRSPP